MKLEAKEQRINKLKTSENKNSIHGRCAQRIKNSANDKVKTNLRLKSARLVGGDGGVNNNNTGPEFTN